MSFLGYLISVRILDEPAQGRLIVRSVTFALVIYILFCIGECVAWSHGIFINTDRAGSWLESTFGASTLGPWVPALSGTTFDPNRSGLILTMYLVLLDTFVPESRSTRMRLLRFTIALLVLLAPIEIRCPLLVGLLSILQKVLETFGITAGSHTAGSHCRRYRSRVRRIPSADCQLAGGMGNLRCRLDQAVDGSR